MADHYYSVNLGENATSDVTTGTSSTAGDTVELRITDSASHTKLSVLNAIEVLKSYIVHAGTDAPA
jgi:hypothetical protein